MDQTDEQPRLGEAADAALSDPSAADDGEADDTVIGRAFMVSLVALLGLAAIGAGVYLWLHCAPPPPPVQQSTLVLPAERAAPQVEIPQVSFTDITAAAGIDFVHYSAAEGQRLLPETMGSGCAAFDYDSDGDADLLFANGTPWPWARLTLDPPPKMALYRNDGQGHFTNQTTAVGLNQSFYGTGVAVGDYDNDGRVDLFVASVHGDHLFRNTAEGFVDVTDEAGVAGAPDAYGTSCGFVDYDRDGDLDLVVCNYVQWSRELDLAQDFRLVGIGRAYGPPTAFEGTFSYLYRNDGEGRFEDVSERAGLHVKNPHTGVPVGKSLGLAPVDLDRDGWIDLVMANDTVQNFVFHNRGDGSFEEIGALSGVAFDSSGNARGAMGIDTAFFRNDDALGIAIGNFANEMTALYVAPGRDLVFTDDAIPTGLGPPSRLELKFGVFFFDYDLDGRLDLLSCNGHLEQEINKVQASQQYAQPPHLFWNCGADQATEFRRVPAEKCGQDFLQPLVGRGATFADIDLDGDLDVLLAATGGPPRLLRNDQSLGHHWLRLKLTGTKSNRDAIGAWVEVQLGEQVLRRQVMPTRSYLSQSELPLTIGLGTATKVERLTILWPDGSRQDVPDVQLDRQQTITQAATGP